MKVLVGIIVLGWQATILAAGIDHDQASTKAVYGQDDRKDMYQIDDEMILRLQMSVAAKVHHEKISGNLLRGPLLGDKLCPSVKFADQPKVGRCSGFLIAENILVTVGHCMKKADDCSDFKWVFGFQKETAGKKRYTVGTDDIYSCKRVIERKFSGFGAVDHAVIELDRPVVDRDPLEFRREGVLSADDKLVSIGHPMGLPAKVVMNGNILANDHETFFESDLDTFGGNSGSPVFNQTTGLVEGIVNRGHGDTVWGPNETCKILKVCAPGECHTSKAVRILNIEYLSEL